jgi:ABC-type nitrate/sulfonate/bicarbonate transport system permease component
MVTMVNETARPRSRSRLGASIKKWQPTLLSYGFVLIVLVAWQLSAVFRWVNPLYTSSPIEIIKAGAVFVVSSAGLNDMAVSGEEFIIGFVAAIIVGVIVGLLMGYYPIFENATALGLNIFYSMPLIALAPLIVLWFGIGILSKIVVVFIAAVFPILVSTLTGVKHVDRTVIDASRSFNATRVQLWQTVLLPAALPSIVTGIRLGMLTGLIGVIVGEFIVANAGIGYVITVASNNFNVTQLFVGLAIIAIVSVALTALLKAAERRFSHWRAE